ncbi:hypothetical protein [Herpetosiphon gulosus]|uniref:Secreted protein n=1 Tax=Herpetosiphon gulosus TaxID=1973496 RepID=A0ABP9X1N5_9CHLR
MPYRRVSRWLCLGLLLFSSMLVPSSTIFANDPNEIAEEDIIPDASSACPVTKSIDIAMYRNTPTEQYWSSDDIYTVGCLKNSAIKVKPPYCMSIRVRLLTKNIEPPQTVYLTDWQRICPNNKFIKVATNILPTTRYRLEVPYFNYWPIYDLPVRD